MLQTTTCFIIVPVVSKLKKKKMEKILIMQVKLKACNYCIQLLKHNPLKIEKIFFLVVKTPI